MVKYKCEKCGTVSVIPKNTELKTGGLCNYVFLCSNKGCRYPVGTNHGVLSLIALVPEPKKRFVVIAFSRFSGDVGTVNAHGDLTLQTCVCEDFEEAERRHDLFKGKYVRFSPSIVELEDPATA